MLFGAAFAGALVLGTGAVALFSPGAAPQPAAAALPGGDYYCYTYHPNPVLVGVFGVAEVRLESAGGDKPEAQMRVLGLADALALERLVRHRDTAAAGVAPAHADIGNDRDDGEILLAMPVPEVIRLGLVSNRGMIVFAAVFGLLWQLFPDERWIARAVEDSIRQATGYGEALHLD